MSAQSLFAKIPLSSMPRSGIVLYLSVADLPGVFSEFSGS